MTDILYSVKSSCESAMRSMDSLMKVRPEEPEPVEKHCLVTPEIEVAILQGSVIDYEVLLQEERKKVEELNNIVSTMKTQLDNVHDDRIQLLKAHSDELEQLKLSIDMSASTNTEQKEEESKIQKELDVCQEENNRLRDELKRIKETSDSERTSQQKSIESLKDDLQQRNQEVEQLKSRITTLTEESLTSKKEAETQKQLADQKSSECAVLTKQLSDPSQSSPNDAASLQVLTDKVEVLQRQLAEQTESMMSQQANQNQLAERANQTQMKLQAEEQKRTLAEGKLEGAQTELDQARKDCAHYLEDIQAVKRQASISRQLLDDAQEANQRLQTQLQQAQAGEKLVRAELVRAEALTRTLRERSELLEGKLSELEGEVSSLPPSSPSIPRDSEPSPAVQQLSELSRQLRSRDSELVSLTSQLANLQQAQSGEKLVRTELVRAQSQISSLEKEVSQLHTQLQKQSSREAESAGSLKNAVSFAEASLDAYKKEVDGFMRDKVDLEEELKVNQAKAEQLKQSCDNLTNELKIANAAIKGYEQNIATMQALQNKMQEQLLARTKELGELKAQLAGEVASRDSSIQALKEESMKLQSELESVSEENNRLQAAANESRDKHEASLALLQQGEDKIDYWRTGLESSYQQKKILKQAMKHVIDEDAILKEKLEKEHRARRALEREIMTREDQESALEMKKDDEGFSTEFASFDWARRLSRYLARNPSTWTEYNEEVPPLPEEAAAPVIQNTVESLEWQDAEKKLLLNWMDFYAHGGTVENGNRYNHAVQIQGLTYDILDGFLTLMVPYLKSGVRSEYVVQTFIKLKPSVICDLEVIVTPSPQKMRSEVIDQDASKTIIHRA